MPLFLAQDYDDMPDYVSSSSAASSMPDLIDPAHCGAAPLSGPGPDPGPAPGPGPNH